MLHLYTAECLIAHRASCSFKVALLREAHESQLHTWRKRKNLAKNVAELSKVRKSTPLSKRRIHTGYLYICQGCVVRPLSYARRPAANRKHVAPIGGLTDCFQKLQLHLSGEKTMHEKTGCCCCVEHQTKSCYDRGSTFCVRRSLDGAPEPKIDGNRLFFS